MLKVPRQRQSPLTFRVIIAEGKFQGVISAAGPTDCFMVMYFLPATGAGMMSPYILFASSAYHS